MQWACAILSSVAYSAVHHFSRLSHKRHDFRKKVIEHEKSVLISSTNLSETCFILGRAERDMIKMCICLHVKYPLFLSDIK
jgi:hypothetical protein